MDELLVGVLTQIRLRRKFSDQRLNNSTKVIIYSITDPLGGIQTFGRLFSPKSEGQTFAKDHLYLLIFLLVNDLIHHTSKVYKIPKFFRIINILQCPSLIFNPIRTGLLLINFLYNLMKILLKSSQKIKSQNVEYK